MNIKKTKIILWCFIAIGLFLTFYFGLHFKNPAAAVFYSGSTLLIRVFLDYPQTLMASSLAGLDVNIEEIQKDRWFWIAVMTMVVGSIWSLARNFN